MESATLMYCCFFFLFLLLTTRAEAEADVAVGSIERTIKQQILATIEPHSYETVPKPILTSSLGNYAVYFLRRPTVPGAGGFGGDFCYIEVQDTRTHQSVWESECNPITTVNTCSLVFSDQGLEVFDGSRSAWDTGVDADNPLQTLELVDEGDMRIRDQSGELVWKASDDPRSNQECGSLGSPGLANVLPPFASPVDTGRQNNFGSPVTFGGNTQQQFQPKPGVGSYGGQPLVDSTPFDSGNSKVVANMAKIVLLAMGINELLF